tara:strand:+ start:54 stop:857 length:804 start_codon:yes stop_codon:yes gene_type:complete
MADITLQHIVETIRKPTYIAFLKQPLALGVISNEFKEDEFFQKEKFQKKEEGEDPIIEFFIENLTKLYKGENIDDREENDKLEEFLVFTVLQHDKQQAALKEEEKQELAENAKKFQESMKEQEREEHPLYFAFKDATDNAKDLLLKIDQKKIQNIATEKMTALTDFANKLNDSETRKQILNDTKAQLSQGFNTAKQTFSDVQSKVSDKAKSFMGSMGSVGSMFGKKPEEPVNGGKRKSKKQRKSKKGGKRKSKKNKSKKNKSKKSKK